MLNTTIKQLVATILLILVINVPVALAEQHKIGVILPLSGTLAIHGVPIKNAIILAQEKFDTSKKLEIIFEDNQFQAKTTRTLASKLITQDKVSGLIIFGTNQVLAAVDLTERHKIPLYALSVYPDAVKNAQQAFLMMPTAYSLTEKQIVEAKKRGYKSVAILATQQDACLLQRKIFEDSKEFDIVYSEEIAPQETSVRDYALKIISKKPQAIFLSTIPPQGSLMAKALHELGYQGEIFGSIQVASFSELNASNGALVNAWVISGDDRDASSYYTTYKEKFGEHPTTESIYAYNTIQLLLASHKSGQPSQFLRNLKDFKSVAGKISSAGKNDFTFPSVIKKFTQNDFEYIN